MSSDSDFSCQSSILPPSLQMAPSAIPLSPCVIPSKNSSAIPVSDETQAYNLLNTFPNHDTGDYDLLLKCPQNIVTHPSIAHTIKSLRTKNRKVTFDPESEILKVQAIPHFLHDAIYELMADLLWKRVIISSHLLNENASLPHPKAFCCQRPSSVSTKSHSCGASIQTALYSTANWAIDHSLGLFLKWDYQNHIPT